MLSLNYNLIENGYPTQEGINLVMARVDKLFRGMLTRNQLQQGDTLNLRYSLFIPKDPNLPRMPLWKRVKWFMVRQMNLFKGWLCTCPQ